MKSAMIIDDQVKTNEEVIFAFNDKQKVATLDTKLISQSLEVTDSRGNPLRNRPMQAADVIGHIENIVRSHGVNYDIDPIYVQKNSSHRMLTREEKSMYDENNTPISKWLFDKVITKVNLRHVDDNETNMAIAFAYHDKGIQLAYGVNVAVCSNMSILGGEKMFLQTFANRGQERESVEGIFARLDRWVANFENNRGVQMGIMDSMKNTEINDPRIIDTLVGSLYRKAVNQAYGSKELAPFTINNMSNFVQQIMAKREQEEKIGNIWDLYNLGTSVIKPEYVDIIDCLPSNAEFATFLLNEFSIAEAEIVE